MYGNYPGFDLFAQIQQMAARLGADAGPADIASAWQRTLAGTGFAAGMGAGAPSANPFANAMRAMRGQGMQGTDAWSDAVAPWLDAARREGSAWLGLPAFGLGREHQERLQRLMQAQLESQQREAEHNLLMLKATQGAHGLFERKLAARAEPGKQLESARALFDLWIDAAEEAYAEVALSAEFRKSYGAMVNAQMKLRQAVQGQVEQAAAQLGMPTRTEVDAAHRKIVELERTLRRMRDAAPEPAATKAAPVKRAVVKKPAATKPAAKKKPVAKKGARR
ncbi:MAG: class III poly(R)-hydroxyalkanoic acid synthase subunit PhaE [Pseudomonadota bacterium]|nr:class III poly(R)-hydroxyalkanoic acid synthase subunit PhaE [Pseudomonadota bacterium]